MKNSCFSKRKGITIITLILTVLMMVILASVVIVSYNNILVSTQKKEFANEIYTIQKLVDNYKFMNNKYPVKSGEVTPSSLNSSFQGESGTYSELDLYEAGVEETSKGLGTTSSDIYVVADNTGKVYYVSGYEIGGNIYYTLTDDLKKSVGLN